MAEKTAKQQIGKIGEDIAVKFLVKHDFSIILRNFLRKCGEIDIICKKNNIVHFVEVKTVSSDNVSHETTDTYRPEDNIHREKLKRIGRTIELYLFENNLQEDWQFDVITVKLDQESKTAIVKHIPDLIL